VGGPHDLLHDLADSTGGQFDSPRECFDSEGGSHDLRYECFDSEGGLHDSPRGRLVPDGCQYFLLYDLLDFGVYDLPCEHKALWLTYLVPSPALVWDVVCQTSPCTASENFDSKVASPTCRETTDFVGGPQDLPRECFDLKGGPLDLPLDRVFTKGSQYDSPEECVDSEVRVAAQLARF